MPIARFQMPDGRIGRFEVPDGTTPEQAQQLIEQQINQVGIPDAPQAKQPAAPTDEQKTRASIPARFAYGVAQPMIGAGQLLAHGISAGEQPGTFLGDMAQNVDDYWKQQDQAQTAAKQATGTGADVAGFVGNVVSPANALIAAAAPAAPAALGGKMALGAGIGAASGAVQPVTGEGDFASQKAAQVGIGAAAGGALSGLIGAAANKISKLIKPQDLNSPETLQKANAAINEAIRENGSDPANYSPDVLDKLREHILTGLKDGKEIDAAAQLRKTDFEGAGIQPLLGQITRDPTQYSHERNLRGAIPELAGVFQGQGEALRKQIGGYAGEASDAYQGGNKLIDALRSADASQKQGISQLYDAARNESGRYAQVNTKQFSDMANNALDEGMLGHYLPDGTRRLLNDISSGKVPLTVNNLVQVDTVLSGAQRSAGQGTPEALAIGKIRDALNNADIESGAGEAAKKAFDTAKAAARERFAKLDAIPGLKAVAEGDAMPDNFAQKYIVNGKADEVKRLADALKQSSPEAYQEARNQLGAAIERAAYGENAAGDAALRPEMLSKALRQIGSEKLSAFFSKDEIAKLQQLNRVGAYINKPPDAASVNYSNSTTALLGNAPGLINKFSRNPIIAAGANAVKNQTAANTAIKAQVPFKKAELTPEQRRLVSALIYGGGLAGGLLGGSSEKP